MTDENPESLRVADEAGELASRLRTWRERVRALDERLTFDQYLERVIASPTVAALAHERVYNMIMSHGVDDKGRFNFFKHDLFGLDEQIRSVVEYFRASGERLDTRKRILLLRGPVSSAKSTLVDLVKSGLEQYSLTDEGALYGIVGCPMREEPLHLVPKAMREEIQERHGLYIEGDLCPVCRWRLDHDHDGDFSKFGVERILLSEQDRVGIGTFLPSDPKSQDISELVGSINFSKIAEVGIESNPEAFSFDGELEIANRGLMEFIEMLKADEKFLYVLLTLTQEQVIKAPRFPRIYADLVIVAHTNEAEYAEFVSDPRSEALQDRLIVIDFPYNMRLSDEVRIYKKLLRTSKRTKHLAPHALEVASMLAVLSRLEAVDDPKLDPVKKMRLYNGEKVEKYGPSDVARLRESSRREGMDGISPRYVVNRISTAMIQEDEPCLTPPRLLRLLKDGLRTHAKFSDDDRKEYTDLISIVHQEYERIAEEDVKRAVVVSLESQCEDLFATYISNLQAYVNNQTLTDEYEKQQPPDESLMRAIERRMGVQEAGKEAYRRQILAKVGSLAVKGERFTYKTEDPLRRAIDDLIYEQNKSQIKAITTVRTPGEGLADKVRRTKQRLIEEQNYCNFCADELLHFVGAVFAKSREEARAS